MSREKIRTKCFQLVLSNLVYVTRIPCQTLIYSVGHTKETQLSYYIEAYITILIPSIRYINED